ncbi:uncharacterized protein [Centruroides vittatus]|uniref:uncharacterized protein n=1 Tax=Centruroides vittatus TaxID=120091 RepID=UPI00350FE6FC
MKVKENLSDDFETKTKIAKEEAREEEIVPFFKLPEESGWSDQSTQPHVYRHVVLQQSVTMLAYMDHSTYNGTQPPSISEPRVFLGFSINDLPILIGAAVGAAGLIIIILFAIIVWHCCRIRQRHDKGYYIDGSCPEDGCTRKLGSTNIVQSDSVVFLGVSSGRSDRVQPVETRTVVYQGTLTRSQSVPLKEQTVPETKSAIKKRPVSQPVQFPLASLIHCTSTKAQTLPSAYTRHMPEKIYYATLGLPSIPEVALRSCEYLQDIAVYNQFASCNALDESCHYTCLYPVNPDLTMKSRSLPTWGRCRPRPLSTEDDLNELYAKVSFSKKRKNRMKNDSAAAIAMNKSRSTFVAIPFTHKDTDSLVDNEAVVVYDERTAL